MMMIDYWQRKYIHWINEQEKLGHITDLLIVPLGGDSVNIFFQTVNLIQEQCISLDAKTGKAFLTPLGPINTP